MLKAPRILYFLRGPVPTNEERNDAHRYGTNVAFRNASLVGTDDACEICDGVAGAVPVAYKGKPDGKAVISAHLAKIEYKEPVAAEVTFAPVAPAAPVTPPAPPAPEAPAAPVVDANGGWGQTQ